MLVRRAGHGPDRTLCLAVEKHNLAHSEGNMSLMADVVEECFVAEEVGGMRIACL